MTIKDKNVHIAELVYGCNIGENILLNYQHPKWFISL